MQVCCELYDWQKTFVLPVMVRGELTVICSDQVAKEIQLSLDTNTPPTKLVKELNSCLETADDDDSAVFCLAEFLCVFPRPCPS